MKLLQGIFGNLQNIGKWLTASRMRLLVKLLVTVLLAYAAASVIVSAGTHLMVDDPSVLSSRGKRLRQSQIDTSKKINYRDVRKSVLGRNIFNSAGEVPNQEELLDDNELPVAVEQCNKPTLDLKVIGIIYLGTDNSVVSVREASYSQSDTYRVGDLLEGHEDVQVLAVERDQMIIDNGGRRECYELKKGGKVARVSSKSPRERQPRNRQVRGGSAGGGTVILDSAWVEAELGPGFGNIMQSARVVPNDIGGRINGFKVFAIKPNTLFSKIGLKNGDIVQKINDTSLEQAEQGFALYQTFQEDQEIVFNIMRKNRPQTITVMIK